MQRIIKYCREVNLNSLLLYGQPYFSENFISALEEQPYDERIVTAMKYSPVPFCDLVKDCEDCPGRPDCPHDDVEGEIRDPMDEIIATEPLRRLRDATYLQNLD